MKKIPVEQSVGQKISHDITRIIPGKVKEVAFPRGHVVREEDVTGLKKVGKNFLYVWEEDDQMIHEDDAAKMLYDLMADENVEPSKVAEGRINLMAARDGVFLADKPKVSALNLMDEISIAARHTLSPVKKGDMLAGARIIPLAISKERMAMAVAAAGSSPLFSLRPYNYKKVGIVTTGTEVFSGLVEDGFTPVLRRKIKEFNAEAPWQVIVPDAPETVTEAINDMIEKGADIVMVTGGMSVDPDDRTPLAIRKTGADVVTYGAPVFPGAMFMLAYKGETAIMGLPGCVMHSPRTILDVVLPRVMADIKVTKDDITELGFGGLCLNCEACVFPNCSFGAV